MFHTPRIGRTATSMDRDPHALPETFLTATHPGVGGVIKQRREDFLVEETPLYEPRGEGEHIYLFIEKRGMSTLDLVGLLSSHFGIPRRAIGYAGLKDKHAITRQVMSVHAPGKRIEDFPQIRDDRVGVLWSDYHTNKLRRGHLKGNRFSVRIREVSPTDVLTARRVLDELERRGVPNRIAEQRFGVLGNNHLIGRAILLGDPQAALDELLGPATAEVETRSENQREARAAYAAGDLARAARLMPRSLRAERSALRVLARGGTPDRALRAIGAPALEYYLSAAQSAVFNAVLDQRLAAGTFDRLAPGDVAYKHHNRACFDVDEAVAADPDTAQRLERFAISPSGPMWGAEMKRAAGPIDESEIEALAGLDLSPQRLTEFSHYSRLSLPGTRRPLRVPLMAPEIEGGVDEVGPFVRCAFELPRGAFATTVMAEIMKPGRTSASVQSSSG